MTTGRYHLYVFNGAEFVKVSEHTTDLGAIGARPTNATTYILDTETGDFVNINGRPGLWPATGFFTGQQAPSKGDPIL